MNRFLFVCVFTIYIAISGTLFLLKLPVGHIWFNQWIFDKFFVFQFMSVMTLGFVIESSQFNQLTFVRIRNRMEILKKELLSYYTLALMCLSIMFAFIIIGALFLQENGFMLELTEWYFKYLLGMIIFINMMSCLKCSNYYILRRQAILVVFLCMALEIIVLRSYIRKFYSIDLGLLFSWVFNNGFSSYFWMLGITFITLLLNVKINEKRDFI